MTTPAQWWRDVAQTPMPVRPLLVVALSDDPRAVSELPVGHADSWTLETSPTSRVAEHLGVPIHVLGDDPPPVGHDLILLGDVGRGLTTQAATIAVARFDAEPQLVTGYGSGIDDLQWMHKVADVRERARTGQPESHAVEVLTNVLEEAAATGTPVLLDGVVSAAAAALATRLPPAQCPVLGEEPAQRYLLDRTDVGVWAGSAVGPGAGLGALSGLAMLRLALLASH